jgi:hypothetical protein
MTTKNEEEMIRVTFWREGRGELPVVEFTGGAEFVGSEG